MEIMFIDYMWAKLIFVAAIAFLAGLFGLIK